MDVQDPLATLGVHFCDGHIEGSNRKCAHTAEPSAIKFQCTLKDHFVHFCHFHSKSSNEAIMPVWIDINERTVCSASAIVRQLGMQTYSRVQDFQTEAGPGQQATDN